MNAAIIVAGGSGARMGTETPKQFLRVEGVPIIAVTIRAFAEHPCIDEIIVVCREAWIGELYKILEEFALKVKSVVPAGATRQDSVFNGLKAIESDGDDTIVLIHDAVRPLVSERIITDNIFGAEKYGAVNTVIPASDTIVHSPDGAVIDFVPVRSELYHAQTPQSFKYQTILSAHKASAGSDATDDCQLILKSGGRVGIVMGEKRNFKVTTKEDLELFKSFLS